MLEPKHIMRLKVDRDRMEAHKRMPLPRYVTKPLIGQFTTLSDAILTGLLGIDPAKFDKQLSTARKYGVEFLQEDVNARPIGLTAATSLLRSGNLLTKNMVVPQDFLKFDKRLADHFVIGAFVRGQVTDSGELAYDADNIEIAGWANASDIQYAQVSAPPPTFQSKLSVIMVPCSTLRPISTLLEQLKPDTLCV